MVIAEMFLVASVMTQTITRIHDVQGNPATYGTSSAGATDVSPMLGRIVTIEGVVVGAFQGQTPQRSLGGFWVQERRETQDNNPLSSEGIFVFSTTTLVPVGALVRVTGTVTEYFTETQIGSVSSIAIVQSGFDPYLEWSVESAIITLPSVNVSRNQNGNYQPDLESYEGMIVAFPQTLQISEQYQLQRFNEIKLIYGNRGYSFTQVNRPSVAALDTHLHQVFSRTITYDDGLNVQNTNIGYLDGFQNYRESVAPRMGDTITNLRGVLDYKWAGINTSGATWRVRSYRDGLNTFTSTARGNSPNPRPVTMPAVPAGLKIASFNVENYFQTLRNSGRNSPAGAAPRGAYDAQEFARQTRKIVNALRGLNADIYALCEMENNFAPTAATSTALGFLTTEFNAAAGGNYYAYVYPGTQLVGTDVIAVAFIYDTRRVVANPRESRPAMLTDAIAASFPIWNGNYPAPVFNGANTNRVPLAVTFGTVPDSGEYITVVGNHLKSKGGTGTGANQDSGNGAGSWNARRLNGAQAIVAWLATNPTGLATSNIAIAGDFNSYAMEDPIMHFFDTGYTSVEPNTVYSYVFDSQVGTLDYLIVSNSLASRLVNATVWHINSDEASALGYSLEYNKDPNIFDGTTATRNSDHDPVLAVFNIGRSALRTNTTRP